MSSRLKTAMDDIATLWAALTPPSDTGRAYRRGTNLEHIAHRVFFFEPPSSSEEVGFDGTNRLVRYALDARVRIDLTGKTLRTAPESIADETSLLCGSVQASSSWSSGVRSVTVTGSRVEPTDTNDLDLVIPLLIQVEETDR